MWEETYTLQTVYIYQYMWMGFVTFIDFIILNILPPMQNIAAQVY